MQGLFTLQKFECLNSRRGHSKKWNDILTLQEYECLNKGKRRSKIQHYLTVQNLSASIQEEGTQTWNDIVTLYLSASTQGRGAQKNLTPFDCAKFKCVNTTRGHSKKCKAFFTLQKFECLNTTKGHSKKCNAIRLCKNFSASVKRKGTQKHETTFDCAKI